MHILYTQTKMLSAIQKFHLESRQNPKLPQQKKGLLQNDSTKTDTNKTLFLIQEQKIFQNGLPQTTRGIENFLFFGSF